MCDIVSKPMHKQILKKSQDEGDVYNLNMDGNMLNVNKPVYF